MSVEFPDVFSKSKTNFGSCSLLPFEIVAPPGASPVAFRPYRISSIQAKQAAALLGEYFIAGLIQHSASP